MPPQVTGALADRADPVRRIRDLLAREALDTGAKAELLLAWAQRQPAWSSLAPVAP